MAIAAFTACKTETQDPESSITESSLCESSEVSEESEVSKEPERIDGTEKYNEAVERLENSESIRINSKYDMTVTVGTETRTESGKSEELYLSYGKKDMKYLSESETVYDGDRVIKSVETVIDGTVFLKYGEDCFCGPIENEYSLYLADPELYGEITELPEKNEEGNTVITLIDAEKIEKWFAYDYSVIESASAEAVIDDEGELVSFTYLAKFTQGAACKELEYSFTVEEIDGGKTEIELPENARNYRSVESVYAMVLMDTALYNMENLGTYSYVSTVYMQSAGMTMHTSSAQYECFEYDDEFAAKLSLNKQSYWWDFDKERERDDVLESETTIIDGVQKIESNGIKNEKRISDEDLEKFRKGNLDTVLFCVPELSEITEIKVEATDGYLMITAQCSKSHGEEIYDKMSELLEEFDTIADIVDSFKAGTVEFVITVDLDTYYPVAVCMDYEGVYKLEGYEYPMGLERNVSIVPANPDIYYDITEKHHPEFDKEPEEEEKATPLFYKVTDANGNAMWLLGTIHVGDNRTAYLPDEIYEAFDASDAVAFEVNIVKLNKEWEDPDDDLLDLYYDAYCYEDEDTIDEHIDEDLYRDATKLALILGLGNYGDDYIGTLDYYKPNRWSGLISNYYEQHSLGVYYNKGVDMRLLNRAIADKKTVYEIEDRYRGYEMEIDFSDSVHEFNLMSAVYYTRSYYNADNIEMFEAWCRGDFDELSAMINEPADTTDMTEEEIKAYEEYTKALAADRDALMLEKAEEYLASGKTVFYAVGLAHLLDEETGLLKTLAEAGYTVELVEYK